MATSGEHTGICSTYHGPLARTEQQGASVGRGSLYPGVTADLY